MSGCSLDSLALRGLSCQCRLRCLWPRIDRLTVPCYSRSVTYVSSLAGGVLPGQMTLGRARLPPRVRWVSPIRWHRNTLGPRHEALPSPVSVGIDGVCGWLASSYSLRDLIGGRSCTGSRLRASIRQWIPSTRGVYVSVGGGFPPRPPATDCTLGNSVGANGWPPVSAGAQHPRRRRSGSPYGRSPAL